MSDLRTAPSLGQDFIGGIEGALREKFLNFCWHGPLQFANDASVSRNNFCWRISVERAKIPSRMRRETDFVLEKAAWPTMLLEAGGRICRANQAARRIFGLDDLPATPLTTIWDDENGGSAVHFLEQQTSCEAAQLKLRLRDGKKTKFIAHVAKVARDGQDYFVLQLFKESGSAFSELAYAPVSKSAPVDNKKVPAGLLQAAWPVLLVDGQGKIVHANPAAASAFGAKAAVEDAAITGIGSAEGDSGLKDLLQPTTTKSCAAAKLKLADGSVTPFHVERCAMGDDKFSLLQCFRMEGQAQPVAVAPATSVVTASASAPAATAGEDDFLLQNAEWPVLLVHRNGKILRANRAAVRAFGPNAGRDDAQLEGLWSPRNRDSCRQFLNLPPPSEALPLKMNLKSGLPGDFWAQYCGTNDEDIFLLQLHDSPPRTGDTIMFTKPQPEAATAASASAAVGDVKGVEAGLAHKQKLDCALQLARSVSLDFNNALTSILGHASLLLSKMEANHPSRNSLVEIEKSASRAAEIANDLAVFSRQEKDLRVQVAGNMNALLERTVEIFQGSHQTPIVVTKQLERKLFTANFDEAKMQQALVKILENAVEAIKGSNGKINVHTRNLELTEATQDRTAKLNPGNYVCVEISDNGSGIADDVMPHIFEPFYTTKGARHRGLGLAWVYGIVTNHGGGVAVSSQPEVGTTVRLYLPANRKIVRDAPIADGDLGGTETILVVDDEDLLLTMGRMVLSSFGYTVLTASSGQKALELFSKSKKKIDLVITDLVMPNMSGRELTEQIHKVAPDTRIIWSSGYVRTTNAQEQERYLQKPFTSQDLLRKVKQALTQ
jgi:signal transduction histidine kinase